MEDEKSSKAKPPPTLPANYVTIVQLQERWKKEQQRKEMEKEAEDRRLLAEKERSEMQIEKVEPDSRPPYGRYRNAGARRDNFEVGNGKSKGLGQKEELVGRSGPRVTAESCARREGAPARVSSKSEDVRVLGLHGKSEIVSAGREIGYEGRRRIVSVQFVPKAEILSVNEDYADQKKGNRTVQYEPKPETLSSTQQGSQATKPRNSGDKMDSSVEIDGEQDKGLTGGARGGSKSNRRGGKMMGGGSEDVDEELEKDLKRGSRGGSYSKGMNRIGRNVETDGKPEKISILINARRIKRNSSEGNRMNEDIDEKSEKDLMSDTRGGSNNNSGGSNGIDKNVDIDGKLENVPMSDGARIRSIRRISGGNRMKGDIDEKLEKDPVSDTMGGSNNNSGGSNGIDKYVGGDGKLEKVPTSGARRRSIHNSSGGNRMKGDIDEKLEKDQMSDTRGGSNNNSGGSNGIDKNVDIDGKLEKDPVSDTMGGSNNNSGGSNGIDKNVGGDGKLEKVPTSGARRRHIRRISRGNRMNGDADEKSKRVPMSGARGGSNNYRKGSSKIDRDVDIDGKSEKVLMSGTRAGVNRNSSGSNWMDRNGDIDEILEKVPVSGARGGSNNYTNGSYRNVDTDGKLETFSMTGAGGGSNTSNEGDWVNQSVYVQGKLERVRISGARRGNSFRWAEKRGFERERSHNSMRGMVWVKKGEVSHDNAAGIQSSGGSSKGSE